MGSAESAGTGVGALWLLSQEGPVGPPFPQERCRGLQGPGTSPSMGALWPLHPCHLRSSGPIGRGRDEGGSRPGKPEPPPLVPPPAPPPAPAPAEPSAAEVAGERALKRLGAPGPLVLPPRSPVPRTEAARAVRAPSASSESPAVQGIPQPQPPPNRDGRSPRLSEPGGGAHGPARAAPPPRPPPQARAPPAAAGPGGPDGGRGGRGRGWGRRGRQARPPLTGSRAPQQAEDAALEGSSLGLGALQLCALHLDVSGRPTPQPPPRTRASPAAPATSNPGRPDRPPGPVPCTTAGRPGRRGTARADALGGAIPKCAPSDWAPAAARACAVGDTTMRAARARGARERVGPRLHVRRDGAVPLLRRRVRGGHARLRPGLAAPAPAAARAAGENSRAALLPPDGLRGRSVFSGHEQPLPHGARAVGARVRLRVTLPHWSQPDSTQSYSCQTSRQTAHAQKMPSRFRDSRDNCTEIKCGKLMWVLIVRTKGVRLWEGQEDV